MFQMNRIGYTLDQRHLKRTIFGSSGVAVVWTNIIGCVILNFYVLSSSAAIPLAMQLCMHAVTIFIASAPVSFLILYSYFLLSIRIRFRLLNDALRNLIGTTNAMARLHRTTSNVAFAKLNRLAINHDNLTDGIDIINRFYSFQVSIYRILIDEL